MPARRSFCTSLKHRCRWCIGDCPQHPVFLQPQVSAEQQRLTADTWLPGRTLGQALLVTCQAEAFAAKYSHRRKNWEDPTTLPRSRVLIHLKGATFGTKNLSSKYYPSFQVLKLIWRNQLQTWNICPSVNGGAWCWAPPGLFGLTWLLKEMFSFDFLDVLTFFLFMESSCAA